MIGKDWDKLDEEEFTKAVIIPLLERTGYMEVTYNHGIQEFGKDVVFSEYDKFGNKKYHAAQVKAVDISGSIRSDINGIIAHIESAFDTDFPDLITKENVRISDFFVITSRTFKGNAKTRLLGSSRLKQYIHRISFYEGRHIKSFYERSYRDIKELLIAQLNELSRNTLIANAFIGYLSDDSHESVRIKYINHNLPFLVGKLSQIEEYRRLRLLLEEYEFLVERGNGSITLMPVLKVLRGSAPEKNDLIGVSKAIIARGEMIVDLIKAALQES